MQLITAVFLAGIAYLHSVEAARSVLVGALICTAGHAVAAAVYFTRDCSTRPRAILRSAYLSEMLKLGLMVVLFVAAFSVTRAWQPLLLFGGYLAAQAVYWTTPFLMDRRQDGDN